MNNDSNLIFERYMASINEALMPWKSGRKASAGLGKKSLVRHTTQIRLKDEVRRQQIEIAIKHGRTLNVVDALAEMYYNGDQKKVRRLISEYTGVGDPNTKTMFNPLEYGLPPYTIPMYDIPNRILAVKTRHAHITGHTIDKQLQKSILKRYYQLLCDIYRKNGGNPEDTNELDLVLSFPTKIHHEFQKWGNEHRDVLRPQLFGGESEADKNNEFVHITNTRELQGKNWDRLSKEEQIGNLLFWGDPRTPETSSDTKYKPDSHKTPDNPASPESMGTPTRQDQAKRRDVEEKIPSATGKQQASLKGQSTKLYKKITGESPTKTSTKKPKSNKSVKKESYQPFIKIIPF